VRNYTEQYEYDPVGNFERMIHQAGNGNWTRSYDYDETSQLEPGKVSNRLTGTTIGAITETYSTNGDGYDKHGNMLHMPHLPLMQWDYRDQLQATSKQVVKSGTPETTYYVYDEAGQRVRKVTERQADAGEKPIRKAERIYLGGFEIYHEYGNDGDTVKLERETLHIMDDQQRIALVETRTRGNDGSASQLIRYQLGNHLGSANLELDAQAQVISYEEYFPYGSTSYQAGRSMEEVQRKHYRYTGKERDEESGFYYHGARYYTPWLGRWMSTDPAGFVDGNNLYQYVGQNPIVFEDPNGLQQEEKTDQIDRTPGRNAAAIYEGKLYPDYATTLADDPAFKDIAYEEWSKLDKPNYKNFRTNLNKRIKSILESEAKHPLKDLLELTKKSGKTYITWKSGIFKGQKLNYAHGISQSVIKRLSADPWLTVDLTNLSPAGENYHLSDPPTGHGHPEGKKKAWGKTMQEEAKNAIRNYRSPRPSGINLLKGNITSGAGSKAFRMSGKVLRLSGKGIGIGGKGAVKMIQPDIFSMTQYFSELLTDHVTNQMIENMWREAYLGAIDAVQDRSKDLLIAHLYLWYLKDTGQDETMDPLLYELYKIELEVMRKRLEEAKMTMIFWQLVAQ
jgi:RHS repeat-associated protein